MFSTSPFQRGAIEFASVHGIGLVSVTEGRYTIIQKAATPAPALSRAEAHERYGVPTFVGYSLRAGETPDATSATLISTRYPEHIRELLMDETSAALPTCYGVRHM